MSYRYLLLAVSHVAERQIDEISRVVMIKIYVEPFKLVADLLNNFDEKKSEPLQCLRDALICNRFQSQFFCISTGYWFFYV
jgi:hypothetical protein